MNYIKNILYRIGIIKLKDNEYWDLSKLSEEEKNTFLNNFVKITCKEILRVFLSLGLKTHIESMVINEPTGEQYIFSFRKVAKDIDKKIKPNQDYTFETGV